MYIWIGSFQIMGTTCVCPFDLLVRPSYLRRFNGLAVSSTVSCTSAPRHTKSFVRSLASRPSSRPYVHTWVRQSVTLSLVMHLRGRPFDHVCCFRPRVRASVHVPVQVFGHWLFLSCVRSPRYKHMVFRFASKF